MKGIWERTEKMPEFPPLAGEIRSDVLVIGGGITGILCAHALREAGVGVALVEAGRLCHGTTGGTTAKITIQHGLFCDRLLHRLGRERAELYLWFHRSALSRYRELSEKIPCGFEEKDSYVYSLGDRGVLEREARALGQLGVPATVVETPSLPFHTAGAVRFPGQAQFHPLKLLSALAKGLEIYENTRVIKLSPGAAETSGGTVRAKQIVVATHFPFLNRHGSYFMKLYQDRSYVLALEGAPAVDGMYVDEAEGGLSFRNAEGLLLLGGGGGRTGKKHRGFPFLTEKAHAYYPHASEVCRWGAQDCVTLDGLPYIGRYSKRTDGLYAVTGFGKWGMTTAMGASELIRDLILEKENPCAALFSPSRSMLRRQLAVNSMESAAGILRPTVPRCPHMGCALRWNAQESTWDCPCHGSRFTRDGTLLENPSNKRARL